MPPSEPVVVPHQGTADTEPTITDALRLLERRGYSGQFMAQSEARIQCLTCRQTVAASAYELEAAERVEGTSDPSEEAIVIGLRCGACKGKGTMVIPFGPGAAPEDLAAFEALQEGRPDH